MKKYIVLVLALICVFSLAGCNGNKLNGQDSTGTTNTITGNAKDSNEQDDFSKEVEDIVQYSQDVTICVGEQFYEDENYIYSFGTPMSDDTIITYTDGSTQNVKEALEEGNIEITDLDTYGIKYYADAKQEEERTEFIENSNGGIHTARVIITEWQSDGFVGIVTDYTRFDAYDIGTELFVKFDENSSFNVHTDTGGYADFGMPESQRVPVETKVYISFDERKVSSEISESNGETKIVVYVINLTSEYFY